MRWFTGQLVVLMGQAALTMGQVQHGTIGMGIVMYKPLCMYACQGALSALYLNCTTFEDHSDMEGMEGMDMKLRKRMDMGGEVMGMTSDGCLATDPAWLQTMAYCFKQRCADDGVKESEIEGHWQALVANGADVKSYQSALPAVAPTVEVEAEAMWLNETSLVNEEAYLANHRTFGEFEYQEDMHVVLSVVIMVLTVATCLLAGLYTWFSSSSRGSLIPAFISKNLMLPALFNGRHQEPLPFKIGYAPSRIVSLVVTLYVVLNIIFSAAPYKSQTPNVWFSDVKSEIATYIANRTGVLSFANLALAILFAGRNNPLIYVSGLSQTTCLIFHRWAARVSTVQAIIHSIIYTCTYFWSGGAAAYYEIAADPFYWWGIIATVVLFLLIALSVLQIRLRMYELFLITHIILAILALVGCWYHIDIRFFKKWGYEVWLYIAFAFWGFERLTRLFIIMYRNMMGHTTQAIAELTPGRDFMKLTVFPGKPWKFVPGQHAFLFFPSTGRFWESHPFSIAGWDNGLPTPTLSPSPITETTSDADPEKDLRIESNPAQSIPSTSNTPSIHNDPRSTSSRPSITFLIRPHKGITQSLHTQLKHEAHGRIPLDITLEGPYGHSANLDHADRILCIGGGIGITALLSYIQFFTEGRRSGTIRATRLLLAWSHREAEFCSIIRKMLPLDAERLGVELQFTHTSQRDNKIGRMAIGDVVAAEAEGVRRLAVVSCGPAAMADAIRRAVVENVGRGTTIDLHEDSFAW